ncbi:hypothetical protein Slin15195_G118430 [Septoria linicola]|uniref:Uncharacterized protein n=1 Tax=Septoria linicola TaxID=215465 RepID=A0A9Q9B0A8_9PEZI|nr:hypothetical protein Slin14017_G095420 [Septoria linicola]USW58524.1 hypothetical protein Slin15195_G118430 [Septoria linicola]
MPHAQAQTTTSVLQEQISSHIHQLNHHAANLTQQMQYIPHVSEWHPESGAPRPSFWADLKYIYRRHRFLHRKALQNVIRTLGEYDSFEYRARELRFRDGCDLWRLERLTWTYAQIARYTNEGLQEAQQSKKWRRKRMSNDMCAAMEAFLEVQIEWLKDLESSHRSMYIMTEMSLGDRLEIVLKSPAMQQDLRLRQIAAVWKDECKFGPVDIVRSLGSTSQTLARYSSKQIS